VREPEGQDVAAGDLYAAAVGFSRGAAAGGVPDLGRVAFDGYLSAWDGKADETLAVATRRAWERAADAVLERCWEAWGHVLEVSVGISKEQFVREVKACR
jgi:hypothetical protein